VCAELEDRQEIRVVQRTRGSRFLLESAKAIGAR